MDVVSHADEVGALRETRVVGRQNRTDAVSALFLAHHRRLVGLSSLLVDDPGSAEEVVQEAFLALWRHPEGYDEERGSVRSWLMGMVHHRAVDLVRRRENKQLREAGDDRLTGTR